MTAGRTRIAGAVALVAAAAVAAVLLLAGGAQGGEGSLAWKDVRVFDSGIETDRILAGKVTNTSLADLDFDVEDVGVYDAQGGEVEHGVRFLEAFAHGIYGWSDRREMGSGDFERRRMGEILTLKPGQSAPITLSWRVREGGAQPVRVDLGPAELELPGR